MGQVKRKELFKFSNAFKLVSENPMYSTKLNQKEILKYFAIFFMQQQKNTSKFRCLLLHFTEFYHLNVFSDGDDSLKENWVFICGEINI